MVVGVEIGIGDLYGDAKKNCDALMTVFDEQELDDYAEAQMNSVYKSEDDAVDELNDCFSGSLRDLVEKICVETGKVLSEKERLALGVLKVDTDGRKYQMIDEQSSQMSLFPGEPLGKRKVYID